ncbi:MAG: DUF4173 domain-containing protein [Eubacteriaceae bacterium]|nr:DUF4173 domain-containing protein [Eubacteriaceae bacterium]
MKKMNENTVLKTYRPETAQPPRTFEKWEVTFAVLSILGGYLFVRFFPAYRQSLYAGLLVIGMYIFAGKFLKKSNVVDKKIFLLTAFVLSACIFINGGGDMTDLCFLAAVALWPVYIYFSFNPSGEWNYFFTDAFKALAVMPFASFFALFSAIKGANKTEKKPYRTVLTIAAGLIVSIIPCSIIISLLSYDSLFGQMMEGFWGVVGAEILYRVFVFIISIPCTLYIFGTFISAKDNKKAGVLSHENCEVFSAGMKFSPLALSLSAALPVLGVYALFFFSQKELYLCAFSGVLPAGYTYAVYAREGFFELCTVCAINAGILILLHLITKADSEGKRTALKVLNLAFIAATLILMATAFSKLYLYISVYGMTVKRLNAGWFLIVLTLCFIASGIKQFYGKLNLVKAVVLVVAIAFCLLAISCPNARIASYNVANYLGGRLERVDIEQLCYLGESAVPAMVRLAQEGKDALGDSYYQLNGFLQNISQEISEKKGLGELSLPLILARDALRKGGYPR